MNKIYKCFMILNIFFSLSASQALGTDSCIKTNIDGEEILLKAPVLSYVDVLENLYSAKDRYIYDKYDFETAKKESQGKKYKGKLEWLK